MNDCPKLSVNIYKFGDKLAKSKFKSAVNKTEFTDLLRKFMSKDYSILKKM